MKSIETVAVLLLVMILVTTPALAGGFVKLGFSTSIFFNSTNFGDLKSQFNNTHIVSGTAPRAEFSASLDSSSLTKVTNYGATLNDTDTYFAYTLGKYNVSAREVGESPKNKSVTVNSYIIMPHKFDAIQFIDMHFDKENLTQADVKTNLTYKGKTYQFEVPETKKDNESSFNLFLQPFCKEFENIGIDATSSTYEETASSGGIDYSGGLTIQAGRV
jgi:hypothetical protein